MAISDEPDADGGIERPDAGTEDHAGTPDPGGGGCLKFGWGCLPVAALMLAAPVQFFL